MSGAVTEGEFPRTRSGGTDRSHFHSIMPTWFRLLSEANDANPATGQTHNVHHVTLDLVKHAPDGMLRRQGSLSPISVWQLPDPKRTGAPLPTTVRLGRSDMNILLGSLPLHEAWLSG